MTKDDTIQRLCQLCSHVGDTVFKSVLPSDCFCDDTVYDGEDYHSRFVQMDPAVITFIVNAVNERVEKVKQIRQLAKELEIKLTGDGL
jgi:hypothetical protein